MLLVTTICELEYLTVNAAMQRQSSTVVLHDTNQRDTLQEGNPQPNPMTNLIPKTATASRFAHTPSAERSTLANMERLQASRPQTTAQTWMQRTCCGTCTSSQLKLWRIRCTYMHLYVPVKEWEQSHYAKKHVAAGHSEHPLCRSDPPWVSPYPLPLLSTDVPQGAQAQLTQHMGWHHHDGILRKNKNNAPEQKYAESTDLLGVQPAHIRMNLAQFIS